MKNLLVLPLLLLLASCAADLGPRWQIGPYPDTLADPFYDGGNYEPSPFSVDEMRAR